MTENSYGTSKSGVRQNSSMTESNARPEKSGDFVTDEMPKVFIVKFTKDNAETDLLHERIEQANCVEVEITPSELELMVSLFEKSPTLEKQALYMAYCVNKLMSFQHECFAHFTKEEDSKWLMKNAMANIDGLSAITDTMRIIGVLDEKKSIADNTKDVEDFLFNKREFGIGRTVGSTDREALLKKLEGLND